MMPKQGTNMAALKWTSPDPFGLPLDSELTSSQVSTVSARGLLHSPKRTQVTLSHEGWRESTWGAGDP